MANTWFNKDVYLANKLKAWKETSEGAGKSLVDLEAAITAAGMTPETHFIAHGAAEGLSPNEFFNVDEYLAAQVLFLNKRDTTSDWTADKFKAAVQSAGMTLWGHYQQHGWNEVNPSNSFDTAKYFEAKLAQLKTGADSAAWAGKTVEDVKKAFADANIDPVSHYFAYGKAEGLTAQGGTTVVTPPSAAYTLTAGQDTIQGSNGNDVFSARIFDNQNTLQSGDKIVGGAGDNDTLKADIGNSQKFAITPELESVERVEIRVQADQTDSGDNNIAGVGIIDAERSVGVNHWESNNSRADLIIEDVRIGASQITKDVTIAFVESDPGHVDFGVYFDQYSLRSQTNTSSTLALEVMDTRSASAGEAPLKESPYHGVAFNVTFPGATAPKLVSFTSQAIDDAKTYEELVVAIQNAIDANPELTGFKASLGADFQAYDTLGKALTGKTVLITTNTGATISAEGTGAGWVANGAVPPSSGLHTKMSNETSNSTELVTSTIILDDVGRGSTGGDLVVGGLSVGDTSTSQGVGRFEIEVRDNSKLQTISSTNNTLKEVTLKNGVTSSSSTAYTTTNKDAGNLTVNGVVGTPGTSGTVANANNTLPGSSAIANAAGFTDVRLIDGSAMKGDLAFTAAVTQASIKKYLNLQDVQANPAADNIAFEYKGGAGNDTMVVNVDGNVLASRTLSGREDFTFTADGGAGNDTIVVTLDNSVILQQNATGNAVISAPVLPAATDTAAVSGATYGSGGNSAAWLADQQLLKNVTINGGDGNDTISKIGNGNAVINAGSGNDVVYADNSGWEYHEKATNLEPQLHRATWVLGAQNADLDDLQAQTTAVTPQFLYKGKLTVSLSSALGTAVATTTGLSATVDLPTNANYGVTQLHINQAIKKAITENDVLKKLLTVEDGPANTLVVKSLIDGAAVANALSVSVAAAPAISAADQAQALAAYKLFTNNTGATTAAMDAAQAASAGALNTAMNGLTGGGVGSTFATVDGAEEVNGANSLAHSDNVINAGAGADVVVLGTGANSNDTVVFAGYEQGSTTIVNFTTNAVDAAAADKLNFNAYLTTQVAATGALEAKNVVAANALTANDVAQFTAFVPTATQTFAGLTADVLKAAIVTGGTAYAGLSATTVDATGAGKGVLLVENNANLGEYKAFELTWTATDFTEVKLIGSMDFGATVALTLADLA